MNNKIKCLLVHWNQFKSKGGTDIAKALEKNNTIETFDISFNNIGWEGDDNEWAEAFKIMFRDNKSIIHIDISYCGFNMDDILIINEGLSENHTIWGIHSIGNAGKIDQLGFLVPITTKDDPVWFTFTRITSKFQAGVISTEKLLKSNNKTNCWIWEGWTEHWFEFTPGISWSEILSQDNPIYLNCEIDEYKDDMLLPESGRSGTFTSFRMLPPLNLSYYFTAENKVLIAVDQDTEESKIIKEDEWITTANIIKGIKQQTCLYTKESLSKLTWIPRPPPKSFERRDRIKTPWDFFKSVFRGNCIHNIVIDYKLDTPALLNNWFEFDWEWSKIPKVIKDPDELDEVKKIIKSTYKE